MEDYGFNVLGKLAVKDSIEKDDLRKAKELGKLLTLDIQPKIRLYLLNKKICILCKQQWYIIEIKYV